MESYDKLFDQKITDARAIVSAIGKTIQNPSESYSTFIKESGEIGAAALAAMIMSGGIGGILCVPVAYGFTKLYKKWAQKIKAKRKSKEKEALLKDIISKQQALINKLKIQNEFNQQQIRNLQEALQALKEVQKAVDADFVAA